jgi:nucleotide-binding universal stress UspA family protein
MGSVSEPKIVVGVDGSAGSRRALRWAAEEARQKDATLRVVLAWEPAGLAAFSSVSARADRREEGKEAQSLLADTVRSVFGADVPDHVVAKVVQGVAERVLVEESCTADLLVLGSTLASERARSTVRSITAGCSRQARCPVMIIGTRRAAPFQPPPAVS